MKVIIAGGRDFDDFKCEECDKEFATRIAHEHHMKDKHGIKVRRPPEDDYYTEADYQTWLQV